MKRTGLFACIVIVVLIVSAIVLHKVKNPVVSGIPQEGCETFSYNGRKYVSDDIYIADEDKRYMGVTKEKRSSVYFIGNEKNPDVIEVCGSDNTMIYKASDYNIKVSGQITKVLIDPGIRDINNRTLQEQSDLDMINRLMSVKGDENVYEIHNFYTDGNVFYLEFDGCPVTNADNIGGYIAKTEKSWIYVNPENMMKIVSAGNANEVRIYGIKVTDGELMQWLESSEISK